MFAKRPLIGPFDPHHLSLPPTPMLSQMQRRRADLVSCAEQQGRRRALRSFGLGALASAGRRLSTAKSDVDAVLKSLRKTFMGNAGLQRQCRHIWSGRWGSAEPSASISTNFDLPERRPLPKTVLACPLAVLAAPGLLELSMEHARRTRPWGH